MNRQELALVSPSKDMEEQILQYKKEHFDNGDMQIHGTGGLAYYDNFDEWLAHINTSELLRLIEVGASCFNHYCIGYEYTQLNVLHNVHRRIS